MKRIAEAIQFIQDNFQQKPSLEEIAACVFKSLPLSTPLLGMGRYGPKKFLQFIQLDYAKRLLKQRTTQLV